MLQVTTSMLQIAPYKRIRTKTVLYCSSCSLPCHLTTLKIKSSYDDYTGAQSEKPVIIKRGETSFKCQIMVHILRRSLLEGIL